MGQVAASRSLDCTDLTTREINQTIKGFLAGGADEIVVEKPHARHALAVALKTDAVIRFKGPVGWYAAGMNDGAHVIVEGNCGWGIGECMMSGRIEVNGHGGSGVAASIRGGLVFVRGDTGARAGISLKGGTLIVGGSIGYMSGFMMQLGTIIACGDAGDGLGDSMYRGTIYIGGKVASSGADALEGRCTDDDRAFLRESLSSFDIDADRIEFRKFESGRKLWNFSTKEPELWRTAL